MVPTVHTHTHARTLYLPLSRPVLPLYLFIKQVYVCMYRFPVSYDTPVRLFAVQRHHNGLSILFFAFKLDARNDLSRVTERESLFLSVGRGRTACVRTWLWEISSGAIAIHRAY